MYFYFLYKITLLNTGKSYIGYTNDLSRRLYDHIPNQDKMETSSFEEIIGKGIFA